MADYHVDTKNVSKETEEEAGKSCVIPLIMQEIILIDRKEAVDTHQQHDFGDNDDEKPMIERMEDLDEMDVRLYESKDVSDQTNAEDTETTVGEVPDLNSPIPVTDQTVVMIEGKKCILTFKKETQQMCAYPIKYSAVMSPDANPQEIQSDETRHLNCEEVSSGCTISTGKENGDGVRFGIKQEISESVEQEAMCDEVMGGCFGLNLKLKQEMPFLISVDTECDNAVVGGYCDLDEKKKEIMSMPFKSENIGSGHVFESDTRHNSSDSLGFVLEVKNETDAKVWWNQELEASSNGHLHSAKTDNICLPEEDAVLDQSRQSKKIMEIQNNYPYGDNKPTRYQKENERCRTDSGCGTFNYKKGKSTESECKNVEVGLHSEGRMCSSSDVNLCKDKRSHKRKKLFKCVTCNKAFSYLGMLHRHESSHTAGKRYKCSTCGIAFSLSNSLQKHKRIHTDKMSYKCSTCNKAFSQLNKLHAHETMHTAKKSYKCSICDKTFSCLKYLKTHDKATHNTGENTYKCTTCGKILKHASCLKSHEKLHTGEIRYRCFSCDKGFYRFYALLSHERMHTGEKPYKCSTCNKAFSHLCSLRTHKRQHTGEKPYKCSTCNKAFSHLNSLRVHEKLHTVEKPCICYTCDKTFSCLKYFQMHNKRTHNTVEKSYKCTTCGKMLKYASSLNAHKKLHTGKSRYKCLTCDKAFYYSHDLRMHERTHTGEKPFNCSTCNKAFSRLGNLRTHERRHTGKKKL